MIVLAVDHASLILVSSVSGCQGPAVAVLAGILAATSGLSFRQPEDGKLPVRERPQRDGPGTGGFGGMGGMGGGYFGGVPADGSAVPMPAPTPDAGGKAELLRGLDEAQRELQGEQVASRYS